MGITRLKDITGERFDMVVAIEYDTDKQRWKCLCDCGNYCYKLGGNLRRHKREGCRESCGCLRNNLNLVGQKFGKLTVYDFSHKEEKTKAKIWKCHCECGGGILVCSSDLRNGNISHCGCSPKYKVAKLEGERFGRLLVKQKVEVLHRRGNKDSMWLCECDCGEWTVTSTSHLVYGDTSSCGCYAREIHTGENSHFFKPELTDDERNERRENLEYREWRRKVFERDGYSCKRCGCQETTLHAHHLDGYHWCKERRYDVENGVTLCGVCHRHFHKEFGKENNTEEQYMKWIANYVD